MKISLYNLVLALPVIHVLANITTNYFPPGTINPGFFRMGYVAFVILWFVLRYNTPKTKVFILLFWFLGYNLILVLLNDSIRQPFINYLRLSLPFFLIPIGYTIVNDREKLNRLLYFYVIALFFLVSNYIIANIFGLGASAYIEDSLYQGGAGTGLTAELSIFTLVGISFYLLQNNKNKRKTVFYAVLIAVSVIVVLLTMRRGSILILIIGLIVTFYFINKKKQLIKITLLGGLSLLLLYPYYGDMLSDRYIVRTESRDGSLANYQIEARYLEIFWVFESIERNGVKQALFGTHNLNSATYFAKERGRHRELHVGYMAILHGSGLIGVLLFAFLLYGLLKEERLYYRRVGSDPYFQTLHSLFYTLIAGLLIYLITFRLAGFGFTTPVFLMLGSILGTLRQELKQKYNNVKHVVHSHFNQLGL